MNKQKRIERFKSRIKKRNAEICLLSGQVMGEALKEEIILSSKRNRACSSLMKLEKDVCKKLFEERSKRVHPEFVFTLQKCNGRLLGNREISSLMHYLSIGSFVEKPRWFYFKNIKSSLQTVLLRVNCLEKHLNSKNVDFAFVDSFFERKWIKLSPEVNDRNLFWKAVSAVKQTKKSLLQKKFLVTGDPLCELRGFDIKLSLLMSFEDMVQNGFPLDSFEDDTFDIIPTKPKYQKPCKNSPIFVIDCEMCVTTAKRHELTRITMIDEECNVILDTLVKPHNKITDYLTEHSGITEQMLNGVSVSLSDVQTTIGILLPNNAILCGHSLEFDLKALKMSHPFCIDISTMYNMSNNPRLKTSLKTLSSIFLNESIQNSNEGHCSLEDCLATLKLLKLKLQHGIVFGNSLYGWNFRTWACKNGLTDFGCHKGESVLKFNTIKERTNSVKKNTSNEVKVCLYCRNHLKVKCLISNCLCIRNINMLTSKFNVSSSTSDCLTKELNNSSHSVSNFLKQKDFFSKLCPNCISTLPARKHFLKLLQDVFFDCNKTKPDEVNQINDHQVKEDSWVLKCSKKDFALYVAENDNITLEQKHLFDFRSALRIDRGFSTENFSESIMNSKKNVLIAIDKPNDLFKSSEKCEVIQCGTNELALLKESIAPRLMEYNTCILEARCDNKNTSQKQIYDVVKNIIDGICCNGLIMIIFSTPKQSILYTKIKT